MFKKILFLNSILILCFLPSLVFAFSSINISLSQQKYKPGDNVDAKIVFTNNFKKEIKDGKLICDFVSYNKNFPPSPRIEKVDLKPSQSQKMHCQILVNESMPAGLWRVEAEVKDEHSNLIAKNYREFIVTDTKKQIKADLLICPNSDCKNTKAVFIKGETVYLKLKTPITDLTINATIKNNQTKEEQPLNFSNNLAQIKLQQAGSYIINLVLNKDGYSEQTIQKDFAVIAAPAKIKSTSVCKVDGQCVAPENKQNCPQDCSQPQKNIGVNRKSQIIIMLLLILTGITVLIIGMLLFYKNKTK